MLRQEYRKGANVVRFVRQRQWTKHTAYKNVILSSMNGVTSFHEYSEALYRFLIKQL